MIQLAESALLALKWTLSDHMEHPRVNQSLAIRIGAISGLKTFPVIAHKVIALLSKSNFTIDEITDAIRQDPSLAAGVLRLANSPFYMATNPITSLDMAFIRLGRNTVREVIFAVATMQLFPDTRGLGRLVRDHCAAVASIAHCLSNHLRVGTAEIMFLAGLMHDIGIMLFIDSGEVQYETIREDVLLHPEKFHEAEMAQLGFDHAVLGAQVLSRWKVGEPIPQLVAFHHLPELAARTPEISSMVALLRLADKIEIFFSRLDTNRDGFITSICAEEECVQLSLTDERLAGMWTELAAVWEQSRQLFP